ATLSMTLLVFAWRTGLLSAIFGRAAPEENVDQRPQQASTRAAPAVDVAPVPAAAPASANARPQSYGSAR
ncbi:MAG TPA: hypothetical protein VJ846_00775, partial [Sphingomicrobium sp.]|nr:hypothetical protein [Sphingomicrobium sp.]